MIYVCRIWNGVSSKAGFLAPQGFVINSVEKFPVVKRKHEAVYSATTEPGIPLLIFALKDNHPHRKEKS